MSGIAGIIAFDGDCPTTAQIEALTARLERRGPDGTQIRIIGQAALGHTLLATTPEALVECLPLVDGETGCTITADARIDNRDALISSLDLARESRTIGDGELILRAYLRWGEQCATHLLGDFAFAIWDPRSARLFCARDQIGIRQLLYHHEQGRCFVFATEARAILALPGVDAPLNHDRVSDFLSNMEGADFTSTFFRGITRLPPAHVLTVDRGGLAVRRYWELTPEPILELPSDEAYAEALRTVLTDAVRCRLRSAGPVGAMVSGGLDSNAVAAIAARLLDEDKRGPLPTFSAISPDAAQYPETHAIMSAIRSPLFAPTTINHAALGDMRANLARQTAHSDEPFDACMMVIRAIYLSAQRADIKIVFDGIGGDLVLLSDTQIAFLLREGRLWQALREAWGERRFWGREAPVWRSLVAAAWQVFAPRPLRAMRYWRGRRIADRSFLSRAAALAPFLDTHHALVRRRRVQQRNFDDDRFDAYRRVRPLVEPNLVVARERYDRVAAACGIEPRDPFLDLRVIEFCLSLPRHLLQRDGWIKWILRQVVEPLVPVEITWRRGKEHVGFKFARAVMDEPSQNRPDDAQPTDDEPLIARYESIYLSNWFAYMLHSGWVPGSVAKEGFEDDDW